MRILVISNMMPSPTRPSFGIFVARRIASYERLGADVTVVANDDSGKGALRLIAKYLRLLAASLAAVVVRRPDVVEAHYLYPTAIVAALVGAVARRPVVLVAHGSDVALRHGRLATLLLEWAVGRSRLVICNSEHTAKAVLESYPGSRVVVIPPGVAVGQRRLLDGPGRPVVGFVGTLAEHKGPDVLLAALAELPEDVAAMIVGTGPSSESLRELAGSLGVDQRVEFLGEVAPSALDSLYRSMDVLAVPSRREGFGLVAAESLAAGTPVVVSAVGGLRSIPTEDCGTVVPSDDPSALAQAISTWLGRRGEPGIALACQARAAKFDEVEMARRSLEVLRSVAE